jgi:glycosyltransferase involved in cell wall biosynthesis
VIVPAHNEAAVIGRLLSGLLADARPDEFDIIVVANGCTDETTDVAKEIGARHGDAVTVLATPTPGKYAALRLGDQHARGYPRLYVDADVEITAAGARALAEALSEPGVLAVAPERVIPRSDRPLAVRWYYDAWLRLPVVRTGLFGRGVIGISAQGQQRLAAVPDVMGDDLAASVAFQPDERRIVSHARVVVHPPRTTADLLRRRVRSLTAVAQMRQRTPEAMRGVRTTRSDLLRILCRRPPLAPKLAVFLGVTALARRRARAPIRSGDYSTWLRDESSRT